MRKELQGVVSDRGTFQVFNAGFLTKIHNALKPFLENVGLIRQNPAFHVEVGFAMRHPVLTRRIVQNTMLFTSQWFFDANGNYPSSFPSKVVE